MKSDSRNILLKMNEWRRNGFYCDAIFLIDEHKFYVHKIVLSAASEYFNTAFKNDRKGKQETIELINVDPLAFEMVLRYIYTKEIELNDDRLKRILPLANFYQINCLSEILLDYVQNFITVDNALDYYLLSTRFHFYRIGEFAKKFVQKNFLPALKCAAFQQLTFPMLLVFVSSRQTVLPNEIDRFKIIVDWIEYDQKERFKYFPELIKYVQFTSITENMIVNLILKNALILDCYDNVRTIIEKARTSLEENEHSIMIAKKNPTQQHFENYETTFRVHQPIRKTRSKPLKIKMDRTEFLIDCFEGDGDSALARMEKWCLFGVLRLFGKKEQQILAFDVSDSLIVQSCVMDNCDKFDQFQVVSCRNRLYMSTFHFNVRASYHIFHDFDKPLWNSTKKYYLGNSAIEGMIYLEKYNSIYGNNLHNLYCYNLFADRVSVASKNGLPSSLTFQGPLFDHRNVIYAYGSADNGLAIYLYDPQAGKWQFRCYMTEPISLRANTVIKDRMYLLANNAMHMYDIRSNRFSTIHSQPSPWCQSEFCSLNSWRRGDLYEVNETGIYVYDVRSEYRFRRQFVSFNILKIKAERALKFDRNSLKYLPF